MTETASQPDVTPLQSEKGFSSSRDHVHRARKKHGLSHGDFSPAVHGEDGSHLAFAAQPAVWPFETQGAARGCRRPAPRRSQNQGTG
jgi:hypothetical protein